MSLTDSILKQIADLSFTASIHRLNGTLEIHAVALHLPHEQFIAHIIDGDGPVDEYRTCELAHLVGLRLDDS